MPAESLPDAASTAQRRGRFLESQATEAGITSPDFPELAGMSSSATAPAGRGATGRPGKTSAADTTPISIQIDVKKPAAHKTTDVSGQPRTKSRKKTPPLAWIIGGAVGGLVLVVVIIAVLARAWQPENPKLVLDWPESERSDALLLVNKKKVTVPKTGVVEFTVPPGENTFTIQRRGYKPIDQPFSVSKGTTLRKKVEWEKHLTPDSIATIDKKPSLPFESSVDGPQGFPGWFLRNTLPTAVFP